MDNPNPTQRNSGSDIRFQEPTFIDPLTGLFNQYYLYRFLPEELQKARLGKYSTNVFMMDLDGFKKVNDTYGHLSGDAILKQFAAIIKGSVRATDMVIRYAGDEFVILLPACDFERARTIANQLVENVNKHVFKGYEGQNIHLTTSIGFSVYPQDGEQVDALVDLADKALYLSKHRGKNRVSHAKEVTWEAASNALAMDSFPCPRFINRIDELQRLIQIFEEKVAGAGELQTVVVSGESGIGKTRLINELAFRLSNRLISLHAHASVAHRNDPFYLFAQGVTKHIETVGIKNPAVFNLVSQIPPEELAAVARVVPSLNYLIGSAYTQSAPDKASRFLLFKGFSDLLLGLQREAPVALFFDDIQWADKASIELIRYLTKQEKNKRILLVCSGTVKDTSSAAEAETLRELVTDIKDEKNVTPLSLQSLDVEYIVQMIDTIFAGLGARNEFCQRMFKTTQGNPAFTEEILKSLVEEGVLFYKEKQWQVKQELGPQDIPDSMDEVIKKRINKLDPETKEMILQAAVIGTDFSLDTLRQMGNKDESMLLELLERAKKMALLDSSESKRSFGFVNKGVQDALYQELQESKRQELHYKIGQTLAETHKNNPDYIAGEAAFHFGNAAGTKEARHQRDLFQEKVNMLFSAQDLMEYVESLSREMKGAISLDVIASPLEETTFRQAIRFVRGLQGALKNFHLYPPGAMRSGAVAEVMGMLQEILKETKRLNVGDVERIVLNGKRIPPREREQANLDYFVSVMRDFNIRTVSFLRGVSEHELMVFVENLIQPAQSITAEGGWEAILKKQEVKGITVDEVRFVHAGEEGLLGGEKKKLADAMLMEFLIDKMDYSRVDRRSMIQEMNAQPQRVAQALRSAADNNVKEGKFSDEAQAINDSIEKINNQIFAQEPDTSNVQLAMDLARVLLALAPEEVRDKVIRSQFFKKKSIPSDAAAVVVKELPDEKIVQLILDEYKEGDGNLLTLKDSLDTILSDPARKESVIPKVADALSKIHVPSEDIDFALGRKEWETLPLESRYELVMKLPDTHLASALSRIRMILDELDALHKTKELDALISRLLSAASRADFPAVKELRALVSDFFKEMFVNADADVSKAEGRLESMIARARSVTEPKVLEVFLLILRELPAGFAARFDPPGTVMLSLDKPCVKRCCQFFYQLLHEFSKRVENSSANAPEAREAIEGFVRDISSEQFLGVLVYSIITSPVRQGIYWKGIFPVMGTRLIDALLAIHNQKGVGWGDSFREYVIKKGMADLVKECGGEGSDILRRRVEQMGDTVNVALIEMLGYLKDEQWVLPLCGYLKHKDPVIVRASVLALVNIGTAKAAAGIASHMREEKNKRMRGWLKGQWGRIKR